MKLVRLPGICKNRVYLQQAPQWKFVLCEFKLVTNFISKRLSKNWHCV